MELYKDLDSPSFAFYFMVVAYHPLPVCMSLTITLTPPLPEGPYLPLAIAVDCC